MSDWTGGYVSDIEYTSAFYLEQTPALLDLACLINGVEPPIASGRNFRYCELGAGQGLGANVMAALNPGSEFLAVDFNPAHIGRARALADAAGLHNIRFLECDFGELLDRCKGEEPYDYVTLHGVWTWISPEMRAAIVEFLRRHLAPGGLVYVSYNALPGWSEGLAVQRLLRDAAGLARERSDHAIRRAAGLLEKAHAAGSPLLNGNKIAETVLGLARSGNVAYLAHEHLNEHWQPVYHADVAAALNGAKLSFVGSARLVENYPALHMTAEQRAVCDEIAAPAIRETMKDYFIDRRFRKDIYVRGDRRLTPTRRESLLRAMPVALMTPREATSLRLEVGLGHADLDPALYDPILDALAEGPRTIGELADLSASGGRAGAQPNEVAGLLTGSGQIWPLAPGEGALSGEAARRLNRIQAEMVRFDEFNRRSCLAAPLLGVGLPATTIELIAYACVLEGTASAETIAREVWRPIAARGEKLIHEGNPIETEAESLDLLSRRAQKIVDQTLPLWRRVGAI